MKKTLWLSLLLLPALLLVGQPSPGPILSPFWLRLKNAGTTLKYKVNGFNIDFLGGGTSFNASTNTWEITGGAGSSGPSGPSGSVGATGATGTAGAAGVSGPSGSTGATGATGSNGTNGVSGPSGPSGATGATGATGANGPSGPSGVSGPSGPSPFGEFAFTFDGQGSTIAVNSNSWIVIPFAATITSSEVGCDQSGSIVIDIWKDTYANFPPTVADTITASAKPTISSATKSTDSTLTGWTTSIAAGDYMKVNVDSVTTMTKCVLTVKFTKT